MRNPATKKRILILGGGFGGVAIARRLERLFRRKPNVEVVLVSRDNFVLMTPLSFEVFSGNLDLQSCIHRVLTGQLPQPCLHESLGMMGSLGRYMGFAQFLKVRMHGFSVWFLRRAYYLLQMPRWSRRLRIIIDWTFGLLFRPDIVKVGLDSETALLLRDLGLGAAAMQRTEEGEAETELGINGSPLTVAPVKIIGLGHALGGTSDNMRGEHVWTHQ